MRVLATGNNANGSGKGKLMTRSVSESEKKMFSASAITVDDLKRLAELGGDVSRPSSADLLGSVSSVSESVFTADDRGASRIGGSPSSMLYVHLESGMISQG